MKQRAQMFSGDDPHSLLEAMQKMTFHEYSNDNKLVKCVLKPTKKKDLKVAKGWTAIEVGAGRIQHSANFVKEFIGHNAMVGVGGGDNAVEAIIIKASKPATWSWLVQPNPLVK